GLEGRGGLGRERARGGADERHRRHIQLQAARVLGGRGRRPRGAPGELLLSRACALLIAVALAGLALLVPAAAHASSFNLPRTNVGARVAPDGSVLVEERITVLFFGSFTFGFRDIPLRRGERLAPASGSERRAGFARRRLDGAEAGSHARYLRRRAEGRTH